MHLQHFLSWNKVNINIVVNYNFTLIVCKNVIKKFVTISIILKTMNDIVKRSTCNFVEQNYLK